VFAVSTFDLTQATLMMSPIAGNGIFAPKHKMSNWHFKPANAGGDEIARVPRTYTSAAFTHAKGPISDL